MNFGKEIQGAARARRDSAKKLTSRAIILLGISTTGWLFATASNTNFIPSISVCFRAPSASSPKGKAFLSCSSKLNVRLISKGSHRYALRDIDYASHVAKSGILGEFDDNNISTQILLLLCSVSAIGALILASKAKHQLEEERSLFLTSKEQEYLHQQTLVQVSIDQIRSAAMPVSDAEIQLAHAQHQLQMMQLFTETARLDSERARFSQLKDKFMSPTNSNSVESLKALLQKHEGGWLWKVLSSVKPIVIYGSFGTGKTSTMVAIGLVREAIGFPVEQAVDLYGNGKNARLWDYFQTTSAATVISDKAGILDYLDKAPLDWTTRANNPSERRQLLVDEFTNYANTHTSELSARLSEKYKGNEATAQMVVQRFVREALQGLRHVGVSACLVNHDLTTGTWGKNSHAMRQAGFIVIQKFSESGESPLPRVVVNGLHDKKGEPVVDMECTLPDWFFPDTLARHLSGIKLIDC